MKKNPLIVKSVLIALSIFSSFAAIGQTDSLPEDAVAVSHIAASKLTVSPLCPEEVTCFVDGTIVDFDFTLSGCLDQLLPVTWRFVDVDGVRQIFVDALNIHSKTSMVAFCAELPTASASISLINYFGPIKVHFLGTSVSKSLGGRRQVNTLDEDIVCRQSIDHGLTVKFFAGTDGIERAELEEVTFFDSTLRPLPICSTVDQGDTGRSLVTHVCHDTDWSNGREVELLQKGYTGKRSVRVYKTGSSKELLGSFDCQ